MSERSYLAGKDAGSTLSPMRGGLGLVVTFVVASFAVGCGSSGDDAVTDQPETSTPDSSAPETSIDATRDAADAPIDVRHDAAPDSTVDSSIDSTVADDGVDARDTSVVDAIAEVDDALEADVVVDDATDADAFVDDAADGDVVDTGPPPLGHALRIGMTTHDGTLVTIVGSGLPSTTTEVDGAYRMATPASGTFTMTFTNGPYEQTVPNVTFVAGVPYVAGDFVPTRLTDLTLPRAHRFLDMKEGSTPVISSSRRWFAQPTYLGVGEVPGWAIGSPFADGPSVSFEGDHSYSGSFSPDDRFFIARTYDDGALDRRSMLVTLATGDMVGLAGYVTYGGVIGGGRRVFTRDGARVVLLRPVGTGFDVVTMTTDASHVVTLVVTPADYVVGLTDDDRYVIYATTTGFFLAPLAGGPSVDLGCAASDRAIFRGDVMLCASATAHSLTSTSLTTLTKTVFPTSGTVVDIDLSPKAVWSAYETWATSSPTWHLRSTGGASLDVAWYQFMPDDSALIYADPADATGRTLMKTAGGVTTTLATDAHVLRLSPTGNRAVEWTATGAVKSIVTASGAAVPLLPYCSFLDAWFSDDGTKAGIACSTDGFFLGPMDGTSALTPLGADVIFTGFSPDGTKFLVQGSVRDDSAPLSPGRAILWDESERSWDPAPMGSHWLDSTHAVFRVDWVATSPPGQYPFERGLYVASGL